LKKSAQKTFGPLRAALSRYRLSAARSGPKVFWFFFSKKNALAFVFGEFTRC